jgi:hypothetical protein
MEITLAPYSKAALSYEATAFCKSESMTGLRITFPDRIDRRQRISLLSWYCRFHRQVLDSAFTIDLSPFMKRQGSQASSAISFPSPGSLRQLLTAAPISLDAGGNTSFEATTPESVWMDLVEIADFE